MSFLQLDAWLMLIFCGLWTGGILIFAVERTNLWQRMPIDQFAIDFRRSLFRVDPMMPILGGIAAIAAVYFAMHSQSEARLFACAGLAAIAIVIVGSITLAEPINSKFRRLPEGQVPPKAEHYRAYWRKFHVVRTIFALAAFGCLAVAAVL